MSAPDPIERSLPRSALAERHGIEPFTLFCAYYLGITPDDGYAFQNVHHVAKRFGVSAGVIRQVLQDLEMDPDRLVHSDFDLASAQVDVMHVPEGVSRTALAREHWTAFRRSKTQVRDWARELATDARENERTFGPGRSAGASSSSPPARRGPPVVDRRRR
jgi:hypothetical protein